MSSAAHRVRTTAIAAGLDVSHDERGVYSIRVRLPGYGHIGSLTLLTGSSQEEAMLRAALWEERQCAECGPRHDDFEHGRELEVAP